MTIRSRFNASIAQTSPFSLALEIGSAKGNKLMDAEGRSYFDFISGIGVSNLGHQHPAILQAIHSQVDLYMHTMVYGEHVQSPQVLLADLLIEQTKASLSKVYFLSSGAEAIDTAIKLARKYTGRSGILSCNHAYHGSTFGAMSLMSDTTKKTGYGPQVPDVDYIRFNVLTDLDKISEQTAAVVVEVIQAEAGILLADHTYLKTLATTCHHHGVLLIFDEIQSGMGRTGRLFAHEHYGVTPDVLVLGKALGGGMPLSACMASQEIMAVLADHPPLTHMTTFGGHPVCCAAGLAALNILVHTSIMQNSVELAHRFIGSITHPLIKEIRHAYGLWMALDLGDPIMVQKLIPIAQEQGLLIDWFLFNDQSVRIAPPLTMSEAEMDEVAHLLITSLNKL